MAEPTSGYDEEEPLPKKRKKETTHGVQRQKDVLEEIGDHVEFWFVPVYSIYTDFLTLKFEGNHLNNITLDDIIHAPDFEQSLNNIKNDAEFAHEDISAVSFKQCLLQYSGKLVDYGKHRYQEYA